MARALVDTGAVVALVNRADRHHTAAGEWFRHFRGQMLTTEAVITETAYVLAASPQYSSLNGLHDFDGFFNVDRLEGRGMTRSQGKVTHLAFDPTRIAAPALGGEALLQYLLQYPLMKAFPQPRGE